jgi:hypothetical protein
MKTLILTLTLLSSLMIRTYSSGELVSMQEEAYIDDIPFNTEAIARNYQFQQALADTLRPEGEEYVNDIPFDTHKVLAAYHSDSATSVRFEPVMESYIDDIPFRTDKIVDRFCVGNNSGVCRLITGSRISAKK